MADAKRQIVAFGGGGFSMESGNPLLDEFALSLTGEDEPRVCFLPTASGDADHYIVRFYNAFRECSKPSHVSLFRRERGVEDLREHLLSQDLIYVGGGSVISLLGVWRAHGIDEILREAWEAGIVLCGLSAGSLCWFAEALTGFHGEPNRVEGLGLLPFSNTVHYDAEPRRRTAFRRMVAAGDRTGLRGRGRRRAALRRHRARAGRRLAPERPGVPARHPRRQSDRDPAGDALPGR